MYLKVTKKVSGWIYGLAYAQAQVGDIIYAPGQEGGLIRTDGLAEPIFRGAELDEYVARMEQQNSMAILSGLQITLATPTHTNNQKEFNV